MSRPTKAKAKDPSPHPWDAHDGAPRGAVDFSERAQRSVKPNCVAPGTPHCHILCEELAIAAYT